MSDLPVETTPGVAAPAHEAARGRIVYITEHGERVAAIVPAAIAAELERLSRTSWPRCLKTSLTPPQLARLAPASKRESRLSRGIRSRPRLAYSQWFTRSSSATRLARRSS